MKPAAGGLAKVVKVEFARSNKIHVEVIRRVIWITGLTGKPYESVRSACWWQPRSVEICGQKGIDRSAQRSDRTNKGGGLSGQHLRPIKGERLRTKISSCLLR